VPPQVAAQIQAIQRISKAIQLLRDERLRGFRVDIEVDSTIYPNQAQDKQDRVEFIASISKFLGEAAQLGAAMPEAIPLLGKMMQFGVRAYHVGRDLETSIEELTDQMVVAAKQRIAEQQNQQNPEQIKANAQAQKAQTDLVVGKVRAQADVARSQADLKDTQLKDAANQREQQAENQRTVIEGQQEAAQSAAEIQLKQMEVRMREMEMVMERMRLMLEARNLHQEAAQPPEPAAQALL
jgi:hypothetical protein